MVRALMFSVIIPSRNRTHLLEQALASVTSQDGGGFEVIVVNDGTDGAEKDRLDKLKSAHERRVRFLDLPISANGNGPCRVMNTGAAAAWGDYLCFLDDDDEWIDRGHLADARRIITESSMPVDVICFDQDGYRGAEKAAGPIWLEDLGERLRAHSRPEPHGGFRVGSDELLTAHGFSHMNTTIVRRDFFFALGGFDVSLWYEGDRDFFLRWVDAAAEIWYLPKVCARHNIPDQAARSSTSNSTSALRKATDQVYLLHKAAKLGQQHSVSAYASKHRKYALRKAANEVMRNPLLAVQLLQSVRRLLFIFPMKDTHVVTAKLAFPW